MYIVLIVLHLLAAYLIFCKAWPYFFYPNYFRESKIENYPELKEAALTLKGADKLQTIENTYRYMRETYTGHSDIFKIKSLLSVFKLGDFSTKRLLHKKEFLWCHTQNRLFKSILFNTGLFNEGEVVIQKRLMKSFFVHQWLSFEIDGTTITVDPYYGIFETKAATPIAP